MGQSDATIRRCWQEWVDKVRFQHHDGSSQPRATADREDRSAVTAPDLLLSTIRRAARKQMSTMTIQTADGAKFTLVSTATPLTLNELCPDDHPRCPGQRADPTFPIAGPQPGFVVWGAISFNSWTPLVVIRGTLTAQPYVNDILRTVLLPFLLQYHGLIFQQDLIRHILQLVKHFLGQPDVSPIMHVWDTIRRGLHVPGNVDDLA
ncbi:transposable element Tcb2 transposase [Trichonephila clavipes]|uniref:Transposable element Tcb2 transposase n=1 Tax=Trichonephila clavipes TaxID=2585209 RepID=A0A8X6SM77_TRICX|nr:transposable element Tcb2 transposase [Trichonephila clavipes]